MDPQALFELAPGARPHLAGPGDVELDGTGTVAEAMERAGRMLSRRPMSAREVSAGLERGGFEGDVVEAVLLRLEELGLVDDLEFARRWAEHRQSRGRGRTLVVAELVSKGVERTLAEEVLADLAGDEEQRALDAAARLFPKVARRPLAEQGVRLLELLVRRGFERDVAEAAARKVLPPEGWD